MSTVFSALFYQRVGNVQLQNSFQFLNFNLLVPLLWKSGSSFSAAQPSIFTSRVWIILFANFKIVPTPRSHCWTAIGGCWRLFLGATLCLYGLLNHIFGGSLSRIALSYFVINVLLFGRFTCTGLSLLPIITLFRGGMFLLVNIWLI